MIIDWSLKDIWKPCPLHNGRKVIGWGAFHADYGIFRDGKEEYIILRNGTEPNNKETIEDNGWYEVIG